MCVHACVCVLELCVSRRAVRCKQRSRTRAQITVTCTQSAKLDWWDTVHKTRAAPWSVTPHTISHTHTLDPFLRSKILVLIKPRKLIFQWGQLGKANSPSPVRLLKSYWSPWLHVKMDTYEPGQNTNKLDSLSLPCSLSLCLPLFPALLQVCCCWLLATISLKTHSLPFPSGWYENKCLVGIWFTIIKG